MAPIDSSLSAIRFARKHPEVGYIYQGEVDEQWTGASAPHGGYILAMIATAAILSQSEQFSGGYDQLVPANITAHFLNRSVIGPIEFHIRMMRAGQNWSTIEVKSVQNQRTNVVAQVLFKRRTIAQVSSGGSSTTSARDARIKPMTTRSGHSVLCPLITHPTLTVQTPFTRAFKFSTQVRWSEDLAVKYKQPMIQGGTEPIEWAAWHEFLDKESNVFDQPALLCYLCDMFRNFAQLLPAEDGKDHPSDELWFPTLVYSVRFLTPPDPNEIQEFSLRSTGLYFTSKFNEPDGVHDAVVEVWTSPREDQLASDVGWRHKQRCLAVGTQLAATVPSLGSKIRTKL
ncbi:thioesterase-like superfamily-domain-containing protein [Melampsora americana]|nr:thioesterase-like superfamily-domain-containing protein [Melampsora americana]